MQESSTCVVAGNTYRHLRRTIRVSLPSFLNPSVYARYGYSTEDMKTAMHAFEPAWLYVLALLLNARVGKSFCRTMACDSATLTIGSKSILIEKIITQLSQHIPEPSSGLRVQLGQYNRKHRPSLPVIVVNPSVFDAMKSHCPPTSIVGGSEVICVGRVFELGACTYVVVDNYGSHLLLARVVTPDTFAHSRIHVGTSMLAMGTPVVAGDTAFVAIDEAVLVTNQKINSPPPKPSE